ncbi:uncharacterized protein N7483_007955 [Penicillium malachiteum]|uniref:uncharacterized protein n=1 Tax=Penicillium malachiteum TaxID=1324776 RepID=UPI00254866DD|nr:uncharacterized protein N7483_007955 [Penicillium malachiteum]KAJ5726598.1 hypothetical protein N7483_007955 [Penicillium malachiteum]
MTPTPFEEYAALMNRNGDGYYLYKPQPCTKLHPGVVGFFDRHGGWTTITDVSIPGQAEKDGYTGFGIQLIKDTPEQASWDTRASSSEAQHSFGVTGGLSGALSAAPVDVSAEAKNKWGQTGKAALIAEHVIIHERFRGPWGTPLKNWVKQNAKALVNSPWNEEIKKFGLWAINKTWSTQECKITMDSAYNRDTSGGFDVGATGVAKGGVNASSEAKNENQGWTTFKASEGEKGLVVSYGGNGFKLSTFTKFFTKNPLKQTQERAMAAEILKPVFDENGQKIGVEFYRPIYDENHKQIGQEKIDREADRKRKEEEAKKLVEAGDAEEEVDIEFGETFGETEEEREAEKQRSRKLEEENKEKADVIMASGLPDEEKRVALLKLYVQEEVVF